RQSGSVENTATRSRIPDLSGRAPPTATLPPVRKRVGARWRNVLSERSAETRDRAAVSLHRIRQWELAAARTAARPRMGLQRRTQDHLRRKTRESTTRCTSALTTQS